MVFAPDFKCCFIGFGLMAGSLAKALKKYYPNCNLSAYAPSSRNTTPAFADGTLSYIMNDTTDGVSDADLIILCGPVSLNETNLEQIAPLMKSTAIMTDVGSVKGNIVKKAKMMGISSRFIGGHPMCGSEKTGYAWSSPSLFEDAYYILTPTEDNDSSDVEALTGLLAPLKCKLVITSTDRHDKATAAISHVPHLISAALVELVMNNDDEEQFMKQIAATGFRDTTRIAASSPAMWQQICEANTDNIVDLLEDYIGILEVLKDELKNGDFNQISELFEKVGPYRLSLK